jgi:hypothetical protein
MSTYKTVNSVKYVTTTIAYSFERYITIILTPISDKGKPQFSKGYLDTVPKPSVIVD